MSAAPGADTAHGCNTTAADTGAAYTAPSPAPPRRMGWRAIGVSARSIAVVRGPACRPRAASTEWPLPPENRPPPAAPAHAAAGSGTAPGAPLCPAPVSVNGAPDAVAPRPPAPPRAHSRPPPSAGRATAVAAAG